MRVAELMSPLIGEPDADWPVVGPDDDLLAALEPMARFQWDAARVQQDDVVLGVVSAQSAVRLAAGVDRRLPMTHGTSPVPYSVPADIDVAGAREAMEERGLEHLLLIDEVGALVGVVGAEDLDGADDVMARPAVTTTDRVGLAGVAKKMLDEDVDVIVVVGKHGPGPGRVITPLDIVSALVDVLRSR